VPSRLRSCLCPASPYLGPASISSYRVLQVWPQVHCRSACRPHHGIDEVHIKRGPDDARIFESAGGNSRHYGGSARCTFSIWITWGNICAHPYDEKTHVHPTILYRSSHDHAVAPFKRSIARLAVAARIRAIRIKRHWCQSFRVLVEVELRHWISSGRFLARISQIASVL